MRPQLFTDPLVSEPLEMTTVVNNWLPGVGNTVKEHTVRWMLTDSTLERLDLFERAVRYSGVWS